jgi:signal transduction histidine kinase
VAAREEERRRLRRDLHDGLGPTLTAVTLKADAARSVLAAAPDRADGLLAELRGDAKQAIGDLRRIIYDLRPASLDELGLLGALGEQVDRFGRQGLSVTLQAPAALPVLPAAVEVAAYRIVTEALTNIARHAQARHASVTVSVDDGFCLDVQDDGTASTASGDGWRPGVGLVSMAERVAEVGGTLQAGPTPTAAGSTPTYRWRWHDHPDPDRRRPPPGPPRTASRTGAAGGGRGRGRGHHRQGSHP